MELIYPLLKFFDALSCRFSAGLPVITDKVFGHSEGVGRKPDDLPVQCRPGNHLRPAFIVRIEKGFRALVTVLEHFDDAASKRRQIALGVHHRLVKFFGEFDQIIEHRLEHATENFIVDVFHGCANCRPLVFKESRNGVKTLE